jgi:HAMP domain-containing protein
MVDLTEIEALKASVRGARRSAAALADVAGRLDAADPHADVAAADLDELQRLSLANAVAAQALRGFVESMLTRRGKVASSVVESGNAGIDE